MQKKKKNHKKTKANFALWHILGFVSPDSQPLLQAEAKCHKEDLCIYIKKKKLQRGKGGRNKSNRRPKPYVWVESNSSCDNVARNTRTRTHTGPPNIHTNTKSHSVSCHSRSGKTAIGEGQSVAGAKNKVMVIFIKYMRDLRRKWFCRQSIRRNYNNSALEDGLFHFIISFHVACRGEGASGTATGTM